LINVWAIQHTAFFSLNSSVLQIFSSIVCWLLRNSSGTGLRPVTARRLVCFTFSEFFPLFVLLYLSTEFRHVPAPARVISDTNRNFLNAAENFFSVCQRRLQRWCFSLTRNFLSQPSCKQSEQPCLGCRKKREVDENRLLVRRAKFAQQVIVSAGVCFSGKGRLHFIAEKAKVNAKLYVDTSLPKLVADCKTLLPASFIIQQDSAPAHTARVAHDWIATNCTGFIGKHEWPPNSLDLNPLDYYVWGDMLEHYDTFQPKPKSIDELKDALQSIWDELPQNSINKAVLSFTKRLWACVKAGGGYFEHIV